MLRWTLLAAASSCKVELWRCGTGQCIQGSYRCNGNSDCSDGSDENGCTVSHVSGLNVCNSSQWQCRDGSCIPLTDRCDGIRVDCVDGSDELDCAPSASSLPLTSSYSSHLSSRPASFLIENGRSSLPPSLPPSSSLPPSALPPSSIPPTTLPSNVCGTKEWRCLNGECIPKEQLCDGLPQCSDASDEHYCSTQSADGAGISSVSGPMIAGVSVLVVGLCCAIAYLSLLRSRKHREQVVCLNDGTYTPPGAVPYQPVIQSSPYHASASYIPMTGRPDACH